MILFKFSDYVEDIFQTFLQMTDEEQKGARKKLQELTPAPMDTMLRKQPREEALQKREKRLKMTTKEVPPTTSGTCTLQQNYSNDAYASFK